MKKPSTREKWTGLAFETGEPHARGHCTRAERKVSVRTKDIKIAEQFGIIVRCKAFESDLLEIKDIVPDKMDGGIGFALTGFLSDIYQVIIVPKYDIRADRDDYWEARRQLRENIVALAGKYDLHLSGDRIEDYGEHFYFVFTCGKSWRN